MAGDLFSSEQRCFHALTQSSENSWRHEGESMAFSISGVVFDTGGGWCSCVANLGLLP